MVSPGAFSVTLIGVLLIGLVIFCYVKKYREETKKRQSSMMAEQGSSLSELCKDRQSSVISSHLFLGRTPPSQMEGYSEAPSHQVSGRLGFCVTLLELPQAGGLTQ